MDASIDPPKTLDKPAAAGTDVRKPAITPLPLPPSGWDRFVAKVWPGPDRPAPRRAVATVGSTIVLAAFVLIPTRPGLGWPFVGLAYAATVLIVARPLRASTLAWLIAAEALLTVGAIRASGSLFCWCVLCAIACESLAASGGRTVRAMTAGSALVLPAGVRGLRWWAGGATSALRGRRSTTRLGPTLAAMFGLLIVFGALFASADPVFAAILSGFTSGINTGDGWRAVGVALAITPFAVGAAYLASARPKLDEVRPMRTRSVRRFEWALPLGVLDLLFAGFVAVQLEFLFGGDERVQSTSDLTYAEYARSGFWQLLIVAGLTLAVIAVAIQVAPKETVADRMTLRLLLGALAALTLVIVASALHRMAIYDDAYGYTRLRLAVSVIEIWLGAIFVLVLVAGVRLRAAWLPRSAAAFAVIALLAVAVLNPDGFIASRNLARYQQTGRIDVFYLSRLSADAAPALRRLPEPLRGEALARIETDLVITHDDWRSWNLGRARLRSLPE